MWGLIPVALVGVLTIALLATGTDDAGADRFLAPFIIVSIALFAIAFSAIAYYFWIWPARNPGHVDAGTPGPVGVQISSVAVHFTFRNDDYGKLFAEANRELDGL
ncbi:hypothetical protein ACGF5M_03115 [Gemmatimonadota bacterium]